MAKLKFGLIQMGFKGDTNTEPDQIRDVMLEAHAPFIDDGGKHGVQVLCFQEVFTQPYFCPSQDRKWYDAAEKIPDGHNICISTMVFASMLRYSTTSFGSQMRKLLPDLLTFLKN